MISPSTDELDRVLALPDGEALPILQSWADAGSVEAQLVLGQWLLDGRGLTADPAAGFGWFLKAARAGHPMAMNMVGRCYENGWGASVDQEAATTWFRNAAGKGLDWGMYNYATSLALGRGVEEDRVAAFHWLTRAVALGHAKSMNILGGFYEDGWAVAADREQARALYLRAAEGGDFRGWFNLGRFQHGEGDVESARASFKKAHDGATPAFRTGMRDYLEKAGISPI